jgi:hypothetical protein
VSCLETDSRLPQMSIFRKSAPRLILATCILPLVSPLFPAAAETWVPTASGTYNGHSTSNWSPATVPNAIGEGAFTLDIVTAGQNATIAPGDRTGTGLGRLDFALPTAAGGSNPQKIDVYHPPPLPSFLSPFGFLS